MTTLTALTLGGGIEVCLGAFYAKAFTDEHVAAIRISDFDDVALFSHFLYVLQ